MVNGCSASTTHVTRWIWPFHRKMTKSIVWVPNSLTFKGLRMKGISCQEMVTGRLYQTQFCLQKLTSLVVWSHLTIPKTLLQNLKDSFDMTLFNEELSFKIIHDTTAVIAYVWQNHCAKHKLLSYFYCAIRGFRLTSSHVLSYLLQHVFKLRPDKYMYIHYHYSYFSF